MIEIPGRKPRSNRLVLIPVLVIVAIFIGSSSALSWFVDSLWFGSLGYRDVFWKSFGLQWGVFVVAFILTLVILYGWFLALWRIHQADLPLDRAVFIGQQRLSLPLRRVSRILGIVLSLGVALISGMALMAEWPIFALFWYAPSRRCTPSRSRLRQAGQLLSVHSARLATRRGMAHGPRRHRLHRRRRLPSPLRKRPSDRREKDSLVLPLPWRGISIAFAFFLFMLAVQVYLSRFGALFTAHTIFSGVEYTDAHITITGLLVTAFALLLGAAIAVSNAFTVSRPGRLVAAIIPALACFIVVQLIGWYVNSFIVKPNQLDRELPYIAWNIAGTRQAWDLDRITQEEFPAETTPDAADPDHNQVTLQNIRLWDWRALQSTLRQIQEIRTYYDFPDIDIDRYTLNGDLREVMLAARELSLDKLPDSSRNWINEKLIYTHGYGITMNPVNGFTPEGLPTLYLSNMPVESTVSGLTVSRPEIYFGQMTNSDVYVKTRQKEFNYPQGQTNNLTSYEGTGGIVLGGMLRRTLIAADRGDLWKVPFSDDITSESRLLMRRNILARVAGARSLPQL